MGTSGRTSHKNYARERGKYTSSKRKKVQERASLQKFSIGLNNTTNSIKQLIRWQRVRWDPVKLYPNIIFDKNDNHDCLPTPEEVALACKIVNDNCFQQQSSYNEKFNIPSFDHLSYRKKPNPSTCSPHITFTTNNFFNPPHIDKGDISDYAFYSLALTCDKEQKGYYNNPLQYFGDHFFYMFCSLKKGVLLPACFQVPACAFVLENATVHA
ncbi:hypothetical protein MJO28_011087 [Puccinia striiformis f. sp. tritici]|uniref:Uncharacterized protein n=1 Tax=Puccinia striiformis f. sp. tritici TaxID=168172 RepID=A0ACC0E148_9BASI|nr:hypothetical protein MJO28_011087 [Puccinia striiformis f. sp. tritici]